MNTQNQPTRNNSKDLEMILVLVALLIAWPALLVGVVLRWQIKQRSAEPYLYWLGMGGLGIVGGILLATRANPYPFLLLVLNDSATLVTHMSMPVFTHFLLDALPLWERSLLVCPWFSLILELFRPKNLQASLLAQERQRRVIQASKSKRAARKAAKAPDQMNEQAVFGVLIDNPNT